jgi:hypothetical protein
MTVALDIYQVPRVVKFNLYFHLATIIAQTSKPKLKRKRFLILFLEISIVLIAIVTALLANRYPKTAFSQNLCTTSALSMYHHRHINHYFD